MKSLGKTSSEAARMLPTKVERFEDLLEKVATLSYKHPSQILYFRGQSKDYLNQAHTSTLYPSIYRGKLDSKEISTRFSLLELSSRMLVNQVKKYNLPEADEIERRQLIQWSIIQHYEICDTPLLDITHSLRVACTFAVDEVEENDKGYIYVLALPYLSNRITINSEEDILLIRLLSISPPDAKRPYFQEGYLVGTTDIKDKYKDKTELDLNSRLIEKFVFTNNDRFWGENFYKLDRSFLYPTNDKFVKIANDIKNHRVRGFYTDEKGEFLKLYDEFVKLAKQRTQDVNKRNYNELFKEFIKLHDVGIDEKRAKDIIGFKNDLMHNVPSRDHGSSKLNNKLSETTKNLEDMRKLVDYSKTILNKE